MSSRYVFHDETDSKTLAMEIVCFLKRWGLWQDVQIFTGGKCYSDVNGEVQVHEETHPEKYTQGMCGRDCEGLTQWKDFSNPERLLDMTFEGPLSLLLRHHEYEVDLEMVSEEVKQMLASETKEYQDEVVNLMEEALAGGMSWDPAEYDSYEEWLELNQYSDWEEFYAEEVTDLDSCLEFEPEEKMEFASPEEVEIYLLRTAAIRDARIIDFCEEEVRENFVLEQKFFWNNGNIASYIIEEFSSLLEKYGLWYELGFSWSLTTYRK